MMYRLILAGLVAAVEMASVGADAQVQQRGATAKRAADVGRRLERESLIPVNSRGGGPAWPLGRINARLGQRIDNRLDLRVSKATSVQGDKQEQGILQQAQGDALTGPK